MPQRTPDLPKLPKPIKKSKMSSEALFTTILLDQGLPYKTYGNDITDMNKDLVTRVTALKHALNLNKSDQKKVAPLLKLLDKKMNDELKEAKKAILKESKTFVKELREFTKRVNGAKDASEGSRIGQGFEKVAASYQKIRSLRPNVKRVQPNYAADDESRTKLRDGLALLQSAGRNISLCYMMQKTEKETKKTGEVLDLQKYKDVQKYYQDVTQFINDPKNKKFNKEVMNSLKTVKAAIEKAAPGYKKMKVATAGKEIHEENLGKTSISRRSSDADILDEVRSESSYSSKRSSIGNAR